MNSGDSVCSRHSVSDTCKFNLSSQTAFLAVIVHYITKTDAFFRNRYCIHLKRSGFLFNLVSVDPF